MIRHHRGRALLLAAGILGAAAVPAAADTSVKPYAVGLPGYETDALLSAGDDVPESSGAGSYQMVGIPDGLGLRATKEHGRRGAELFMNHELGKDVTSEPNVGGPLNRGAFVSRFELDGDGDVVSGERAYDRVYAENEFVGPAPEVGNATSAFARFCSGSLWGRDVGFDRPIYLTGEEDSGSSNFDGRGGQSVAVYDNEIHTLPALGHFAKENSVVLAKTGQDTVVFPSEDGPAGPQSQFYMYVGSKQRGAKDALRRNGLTGGELYVLRLPGHATEGDFQSGSASGTWERIPGAKAMDAATLDSAAKAQGAFGFVRVEDAAPNPSERGEVFFNTTGGTSGVNELGRTYKLDVDEKNPTAGAKLTVVQNADQIVAAGGDTAVSPDNLDTDGESVLVQEDGTEQSRLVMGAKGRDGSIWRFAARAPFSRERIVELDPPGRDGIPVGPGVWETSGIITTAGAFGRGTWVFDVQAHSPTTPPEPGVVEDGQLLLLRGGA